MYACLYEEKFESMLITFPSPPTKKKEVKDVFWLGANVSS
jgi:hypothetical protein